MKRCILLTLTLALVLPLSGCLADIGARQTRIRFRDPSQVDLVAASGDGAHDGQRCVGTSCAPEESYEIEGVHLPPRGAPALHWQAQVALNDGVDIPVLDQDELRFDQGAQANAAETLVKEQLGPEAAFPRSDALTVPMCAGIAGVFSGGKHPHRAGFRAQLDPLCLGHLPVALNLRTPWSNVLEITTGVYPDRAGARTLVGIGLGTGLGLLAAEILAIVLVPHRSAQSREATTLVATTTAPFVITPLAYGILAIPAAVAPDKEQVLYRNPDARSPDASTR